MSKYIITTRSFGSYLDIHQVVSETEKQLKTHEGSSYSSRFDARISTVNRSKVVAEFSSEEDARAAMKRAQETWDRLTGPVEEAKRVVSQLTDQRRNAWLAAITNKEA